MNFIRHMVPNDWKSMLIFGILALIVGIIAIVYPGITLEVILILLGALALLTGIVTVVNGIHLPKGEKTLILLLGALYVLLGLVMLLAPLAFVEIMVYFIAAFLVVMGIFQLFNLMFVAGTGEKGDSLFSLISGILAIIIGLIIAAFPAQTIEVAMWIIGAILAIIGLINIAGAFKLKKIFKT